MSRNSENNKIVVIVPAFNEQQIIGSVVDDIHRKIPSADVVVVNDGSRDGTALEAAKTGASVLNLPFNLGIGGAVQTGFRYAAENGYDIAIQIDGDGQHDPVSIPDLIAPILSGQAEVVVGSRFLTPDGYESSFMRQLGIKMFSSAISLILGQKMTDTTSGYRAANKEAIAFLADNYPTDYPEVESLVVLHFAKFRVKEVPVAMRQRETGRSSITPWRAAYYMVKVFLAVFIWLIRKKPTKRSEVKDA